MTRAWRIAFSVIIILILFLGSVFLTVKRGSREAEDATTWTQQASEQAARNFIETQSPTYVFDGFDLLLIDAQALPAPHGFRFSYSFRSRHAGLGDRSSGLLAQVVTNHRMAVNLIDGRITTAVTDGIFDEMSGQFLAPE